MKKAGNALMRGRRRPRDPSRSTSASAASTARRRRAELRAARRAARARARDRARDRALGGRLRVPRRRAEHELVALRRPGRATRSTAGGIVSDRGLDIAPARVRRPRRRGARRALHRAARAAARARRATWPGRSRGTRSASTRCSPLAREAAARRPASAPSAATRSRASSSAPSSSSTPATRRCAIIAAYERAGRARRSRSSRAPAVGHGATEAPRGLLYHRYEIDDDGTILDARIVPPTSQNQRAIEEDLRAVVERHARPRRRAS